MKTKEQIEALRVALLIARHEAEKLADVEDMQIFCYDSIDWHFR